MLGTASNIFEDFIESQRFLVFSMRMVSPGTFNQQTQDFFSFEPLLEPMDHSDIALRDRRPRPSPVPDSGAHHVTMKKWDESKQCCYLKVLEFKQSP